LLTARCLVLSFCLSVAAVVVVSQTVVTALVLAAVVVVCWRAVRLLSPEEQWL
jgi:FtsH-binding integral membrane protein